jgi:sterol desaturase/sphingolipid hydroxylase (fatty acid hydroxylase superfamily)
VDPTVAAIPGYFATMAAEYAWLRRRAPQRGASDVGYEPLDTVASLTMGVGSLVVPLLTERLLRPVVPGRGRYGRLLLGTALAAATLTTIADQVRRRTASRPDDPATNRAARRRWYRIAERAARVGGVVTVATGAIALATAWGTRTTASRCFERRIVRDLGTGPLALALAVLGWDFLYYWNHRLMHSCRYLWAYHVVHHSSEHYNLSTALRQPVAGSLGVFVPYGTLSLLGIRPELVEQARGINLLYQYWIHTETIGRLGRAEALLNTPSHHRVHHGSNPQYLDRNHGSILITWDRWFQTFVPESEPVVYGLTKNIGTFNPLRIATHEYADMLRDVARSSSWRERLSFVVRGPGWADGHRGELDARGAMLAATG